MYEDYNIESAESQEVAEPETSETPTDEVSETQGSGRTEADAAFAEMRRQNQDLQSQLDEMARRNAAMSGALSRYFEGEDDDELVINANAYAEERDPAEYRAQYERDIEFERLQAANSALEEQLIDAEVNRLMREGLQSVQAIDPNIKSLDELGDSFVDFIAAGLSTEDAYWAVKAKERDTKVLAPDAIGKVADTKSERDYFTSEELDALTDEDLNDDAIYEKAMRSLQRL